MLFSTEKYWAQLFKTNDDIINNNKNDYRWLSWTYIQSSLRLSFKTYKIETAAIHNTT